MRSYRYYFLSSEDRIRSVEELTEANDSDAFVRAECLLADKRGRYAGYEIWEGARLLLSGGC